MPAVGLVPRGDVLRLRYRRVVLDRDRVVVVDEDQVAEFLVTGEGRGFVADALLDVPVRGEDVHVVVEGARAGGRIRVEQPSFAAGRHRHADRVGQALPERAGGGLHAGREPVLRVAGG